MFETFGFFSELVIILLLVLLNGVFSMSEMAIVSARKIRLQQRAEDGDEAARRALELAENPTRFLSTVQIGITLIGTLAGAFGGAAIAGNVAELFRLIPVPFIQQNAQQIALALIVVLIAYLSLVLGELVPKRLALGNPEAIARIIAGPMSLVAKLGGPAVSLLTISTEIVLRLLRIKKPSDPPVTPEEITGMMEQGEQVGVFEERETDIVESVFRLGDLRAGALMTPRTEIDWLDLDDPFEENLRYVLESPHNHFPVAEGDLDNVQGILRAKDLLARVADGRISGEAAELDLVKLVQPALFIPESMPGFEVIELLRGAYGNLALVIDEYGGTLGMVTLFDVMKAMVGGISERGEPVQPEAVQREDGSWLVEGMMRIDEFKRLIDVDALPEEEHAGYQTVGGFIMSHTGAIPQVGHSFEWNGWRYEVVDMDGLRVDKVLVMKV